jgi:hypothetical protein
MMTEGEFAVLDTLRCRNIKSQGLFPLDRGPGWTGTCMNKVHFPIPATPLSYWRHITEQSVRRHLQRSLPFLPHTIYTLKMASEKIPPPADMLSSVFHSKTDKNITRLSKILSTSGGVDATLTLAGYSLFFVSSQLSNLQKIELKILGGLFGDNALKHGSASIVKLADLESSMKLLAGMCSDFRTFTRLWGLLGIYAMVKRNYIDPPKDAILGAVAWTQTFALGSYYVYENGYYLAGKGVLKGWTATDIKKCAKTSLKMFLAYVVLEYVRLYRTRQLLDVKRAKAVSLADNAAIEKEEEVWWRTALMDLAYTPLSMHWASENGMLSDGWVGGLMSLVGIIKVRAAWAQAA